MPNSTIKKFGYPDSLVKEFDYWVILLRPKQVTLGCLVLACKEDATALGELSPEASQEMQVACKHIEDALDRHFKPDKLNYLALMMVDPHVHFHVIPRYETARSINDKEVEDAGWPKHPSMQQVAPLDEADMETLLETLKSV